MKSDIYRCFSVNDITKYPHLQAKFYSNLDGSDGFLMVAGGTKADRALAIAHLREELASTEFTDVPIIDEGDIKMQKVASLN